MLQADYAGMRITLIDEGNRQQTAGDWRMSASCRGHDPEIFYTQGSNEYRSVCKGCPVRLECLNEGLYDENGVWGGTTAAQRKRIRQHIRQRLQEGLEPDLEMFGRWRA